jgi:hypothetical protein
MLQLLLTLDDCHHAGRRHCCRCCCCLAEYAWNELAGFLSEAGYQPYVRCFNAYVADDTFFDHAQSKPKPQYRALMAAFPKGYRSLSQLGSTTFIIAKKTKEAPPHRRSWRLYAFNKVGTVSTYCCLVGRPKLLLNANCLQFQ